MMIIRIDITQDIVATKANNILLLGRKLVDCNHLGFKHSQKVTSGIASMGNTRKTAI